MNLIFPFKNRFSLESKVKFFREELCSIYCAKCIKNCCLGRLNPNVNGSSFFSELPVIKKLSKNAEQPYLFRSFFTGTYLIGRCPHLAEHLKCGIHSEHDRPKDCNSYPIYLSYPLNLPFFIPFLHVETGCEIFKISDNCRKAINFAGSLGLGIHFS